MTFRRFFLYAAGIVFLVLARAKSVLKGYSSPRPFDADTNRVIAYDIGVVNHWLSHLQRYTRDTCSLEGKSVLELGPGSDLGTGICLLARGCDRYQACDVNDLMRSTPDRFYERLLDELQRTDERANVEVLREQLAAARAGHASRLHYVVRNDFDLVSAFGKATVDLVFSQAAFEHFDDVEATVGQLSSVCRPGAVLVAEVDLQTHSRWIRDKDPNNIYRYPPVLYDALRFRGSPNRVRPFQYEAALERAGWTDVSITPLRTVGSHETASTGLYRDFAHERNRMDFLTIMLCARKAGVP